MIANTTESAKQRMMRKHWPRNFATPASYLPAPILQVMKKTYLRISRKIPRVLRRKCSNRVRRKRRREEMDD